ncbi:MAG: aminotransferase class IV, partial [Simkania sp.]|nr:aminotransferase class IV [Simkania sp.]
MYYINGDYVSDESATIAITDLGILRGYGVFDYLRTYGGKPFHLQDHLERLAYSAMTLGFTLSLPLHQIAEIISTLLQKNNYLESAIKIIATGGISPDQFLPSGPSSLMVLVYPLKTFPEISYIDGISVATTSLQRSFPWAKTLHYAPAIVALQQGKSIHAEEILYLNHRKEFLEAATSNLFVVKERKLLTTPETADILIGITRNLVL